MHAFRRDDSQFGNFRICKRRLGKGVVSLRYGNSNHSIYDFPNKPVSKAVQQFIGGLLNDNQDAIKECCHNLSNEEKNYIQRISNRSGRYIDPDFLKEEIEEDENDIESMKTRLNIILGEINQGNNNPEIKNELKLILKSVKENEIISNELYETIYAKYLKN